MTTNVYPLDIQDSDDSEAEELSDLTDEQLQTVRDKKDSLRWYSEHSGWTRAEELVSEELEELVGTSDTDELDRMLGSEAEAEELSDRERQIADTRDRAEWYDSHNWTGCAEREYDRLKRLKEGGDP
jgi:hypothetical protein